MNINTLTKDIRQLLMFPILNPDIFPEQDGEFICDTCGKESSQNRGRYYHKLTNNKPVLIKQCITCNENISRLALFKIHKPIHTDTTYKEFLENLINETIWVSEINHADVSTYMKLVDKSVPNNQIAQRKYTIRRALFWLEPHCQFLEVWDKFISTIKQNAEELSTESFNINVTEVPVDKRIYGFGSDIYADDGVLVGKGYTFGIKISISHRDLIGRYIEEPYQYLESSTGYFENKPPVGVTVCYVIFTGISPQNGAVFRIKENPNL